MPPVGQLQGLDVLKCDALLQQDAAQVRRWELREDVGNIWGGGEDTEAGSSADLQKVHEPKPGWASRVLGNAIQKWW